MVSLSVTPTCRSAIESQVKQELIVSSRMDRNDTSFISQPEFNGLSSVWQRFTRQGILSPSSDIIMAAWRDSPKKQYNKEMAKILFYK